eukprot:jgi/Psemu1/9450/gm1.9450_g
MSEWTNTECRRLSLNASTIQRTKEDETEKIRKTASRGEMKNGRRNVVKKNLLMEVESVTVYLLLGVDIRSWDGFARWRVTVTNRRVANNPPAPYTPGPMTQDAANSLLGIMKQPTPRSADPFRNVGCLLSFGEGDELQPLQIDQDGSHGDNDAGANNNSSNNNNNNQTIELEAEPTTRSTRSNRPARVSLEPTPTSSNQIRNPYAKQYNNNSKSSRRQTKKQKQKQKDEEEKEREREEAAEQKQAAEPEEQDEDKEVEDAEEIDANSNTEAYTKKVVRTHDQFILIVADATDPAKNDPGDAVLHEMFTKKVTMKDGIREDYLFYYHVSGAKSLQSKTLVDQAMKIWTTNIKNLVSGDPLNFKSHHTYSRQLFSAFHLRGVPYNEGEFKHRGGYKAVVKKDWAEKRAKDPTLGTKRTKAKFDEFVDEKFKKVINDGIYKPYEDMLDLLKLMAMELGRQFGVRGKDELVFLQWKYLRMGTFKYGSMEDLRYVIVAPGGGFDKSHQLSLNNAEVSTNYPMVVEDTDNPNCIVKLIFYYQDVCSPDQTAKYVFKAKSPVGADTIRKWVRDFAEVADFKDWEKTVTRKKPAVDYNKNSSNNKPPIAPSTKKVVIDVDQHDKENAPVPQDRAPAVVLGTKEPSPSKDTLKKELQKRKKDSKELKKENKKQRTKLQDAEDNVVQFTINLKESNNINKTLSNEVDRLHQIGKQLRKEKTNLEQQLEKQKDLHEKELLHQQAEADTKLAKLKDRYAKDLEEAKKIATKEAKDNFKLSKMEWRNEKGRMESDHRNQVALAETKIENEQRLRDIELKGKQNEIDQLHQHMNQNQCAIM